MRKGKGFLAYSHRRSLIDRDLARLSDRFRGRVLDVGGKKARPRGLFRPPDGVAWEYLNNDPQAAPDILATADDMPIDAETYDSVLCSEVLEHVEHPERVVAEIHRVLRGGGTLVLTMPFIPLIHADPDDYQRYTPAKLELLLTEAGFEVERIEPQGYYFGALADLVQRGLSQVRPWALRAATGIVFLPVLYTLKWLDGRPFVARGSFLHNVSTGFLVVATKRRG